MTLEIVFQLTVCALLVSSVLYDVFQTVVVPRWTSRRWRLAPLLIRELWAVWRPSALRLRSVRRQDDLLGAFAPLTVILILIFWVAQLTVGYGFAVHALREQITPVPSTWTGAFYIAGTSLLTIGYGDFVPNTSFARMIFLSAGAAGLATFALVISWLFTLYQAFARREIMVLTLDGRAGAPPSGITMLETYAALKMTDQLHFTFERWELWTADVLDSHLAYPLLPFFRSSHDNESWISAMGAVLDASTLIITAVESGPDEERVGHGAAQMMYRLGCHAIADLSIYFRFRLPTKTRKKQKNMKWLPHPGVEFQEFRHARRRLEKAGYKLNLESDSWQEFSEKRSVYAADLNNLAKLFASAPTTWIGDRTTLPYLQPHPHQTEEVHEETKSL